MFLIKKEMIFFSAYFYKILKLDEFSATSKQAQSSKVVYTK